MAHILSVPGLYGSELQHWQSWIEHKLPSTIRVQQQDWDNPILSVWSNQILHYIDQLPGKVWIIAHSFGCLASVYAAQQRPQRIAGAMLVAMADPASFNTQGFMHREPYITAIGSVSEQLPKTYLDFPSVVVASNNDPWMQVAKAEQWADHWESRFINIGNAGHINVAAGFGAWPQGLEIFEQLRQAEYDYLQGALEEIPFSIAGY